MRIFFSGGEAPAHLDTLRKYGIDAIAVNIKSLARRKAPLASWASKDRLEGVSWVLYADSVDADWEDTLTVLSGAEVPPEAVVGPLSWANDTNIMDIDITTFLPTWNGIDHSSLRDISERFEGVVLPDTAVSNQSAVKAAYAAISANGLLGALTGRSRDIHLFDFVLSSAWWLGQKHGETQIWTGQKMVRLNNTDKIAKRLQYEQEIKALGVDYDAVLADDFDAMTELSIKSWICLEQHYASRQPVTQGPPEADTEPDAFSPEMTPPKLAVVTDISSGRNLLPVIGLAQDTEDGPETLTVTDRSLRRCDACSLSAMCPSYHKGRQCAYEIPVTIKSKDQLHGVLRAVTEIQTQRVLMARFGEELTGFADPDVGREMDRLFKMVETWRDIEDNRDTFKMTVEARAGAAAHSGMLSRIFGPTVGEQARALEHPVHSDEIVDTMVSRD